MACEVQHVCKSPGDQTLNEGDQWTQYGAWGYALPPLFTICTNKASLYVQVKEGGVWKNCSSTTPIKLINGNQPQGVTGRNNTCTATQTPRATWTLKAAPGSGGQSWLCRIKAVYVYTVYSTFTITVNAPAVAGAQAGKGKVVWLP